MLTKIKLKKNKKTFLYLRQKDVLSQKCRSLKRKITKIIWLQWLPQKVVQKNNVESFLSRPVSFIFSNNSVEPQFKSNFWFLLVICFLKFILAIIWLKLFLSPMWVLLSLTEQYQQFCSHASPTWGDSCTCRRMSSFWPAASQQKSVPLSVLHPPLLHPGLGHQTKEAAEGRGMCRLRWPEAAPVMPDTGAHDVPYPELQRHKIVLKINL